MSDKLTSIVVPGQTMGTGWMEWGEKSVEEMISAYRAHADYMRNVVKVIDETEDADFFIKVVKGPYKQDLVKVLQEPSKKQA